MPKKENAKLEEKSKINDVRIEMLLTRIVTYPGYGINNITKNMTAFDFRNTDLLGDFLEKNMDVRVQRSILRIGMCGRHRRVILHSAPGL